MTERVLLVSHYFPPHTGGIEYVVRNEAEHLAQAGADVAVLTSACGGHSPTAAYVVTRVAAWNGMEQRFGVPFPLFSPALAWQAFKAVRRADVVHAHDAFYISSWWVALWCLVLRRPLYLTQHVQMIAHPSGAVRLAQKLVYRTMGRLVMSVAQRIFVVNSGVSDFLVTLGVSATKIMFLPNGVDVDFFKPADVVAQRDARAVLGLPQDEVLALFVGRFVPKKGYDRLRKATSQQYRIVFAGGQSEQQHGDDSTIYLGSLTPEQLTVAYRACDIFVLPSEAEGFPLTVQEAMASGLPVVTTDDPGYDVYELDRSLVSLVPATVDAVRLTLEDLATQPRKREAMAEYSRTYAEANFSWQTHTDTLTASYKGESQ